MKKILFIALVLVATLYNVNIQAQQRGHGTVGVDLPIKPDDPNGPGGPGTPIPDKPDPVKGELPDEFIDGDIKGSGIGGITTPCDHCPDGNNLKDFEFGWSKSIDAALYNQQLAKKAQQKKLDHWYNTQTNIIKGEIQKKLGQSFGNYELAKNALFGFSEQNNIKVNVPLVKTKYRNIISREGDIQHNSLKGFKFLKYRETEIKSGKVNNPKFPFVKVNGTPLKDIKSLSQLRRIWSTQLNHFSDIHTSLFKNKLIQKKLLSIGSNITGIVVEEKRKYYDSFDKWDKLNLMQLLLNYEQLKNSTRPPYAVPSQFYKYAGLDKATQPFIEDYAVKNRERKHSVFSQEYFDLLYHSYSNYDKDIAYDLARDEQDDAIQKELNKLINATTTADFAIRNFLDELGINNSQQRKWILGTRNRAETNKIIKFVNDNRVGGAVPSDVKDFVHNIMNYINDNKSHGTVEQVKHFVNGQLELDNGLKNITWKPSNGILEGNSNLKFTHVYHDLGKLVSYFKMTDGSIIAASSEEQELSDSGNLKDAYPYESTGGEFRFFYIKTANGEPWAEMLFNPSNLGNELEDLFKLAGVELGKSFGRYVLPIEDIKILIDGKDFDGQQVARWKAAGFLLLEVVPGGKLLKPIVKVTRANKVWRIVVQVGDKTYTRIVRELSEHTLKHFEKYAPGTRRLIDDALRKGEFTDDVAREVAEYLEDLATKKGSPYSWAELRKLFKRGNDFNKKAITQEWYKYHEIHLINGKRLDSYDPIAKEIISRKATDLNNIKFTTFEKYLKEFSQKYKVGTKIRSNKYLEDLDGKLLDGTYILEIPDSNQSLSNIQNFIDYAWENYSVKIRFRPE
ncbi:conserved exported hypothetical protein [Tenacibaculum sp. 190524A02b]|uniref:Uncharacterized protein n=1 Tax=Tenacibaculum vairaonense TaxID=3137860 RepID=A0ABM9PN39_9FLAO